MGPIFEAGDRGMRGVGGRGDLFLSESEFEASLAEVGGNWIGLAKLADPRVFIARVAIRTASSGAIRFGLLSRLSDWAARVVVHREIELINLGKFWQGSAVFIARTRVWMARHVRQREGARAARRSSSP
jgi:hypothetical protein